MALVSELRQKRAAILDKAQSILDSASDDLTADKAAEIEQHLAEAEALNKLISQARQLEDARSVPDDPTLRRIANMGGIGHEHSGPIRGGKASGLINLATGEPIAVHRGADRMGDFANERHADIGGALFHWLRGDGVRNEQTGSVDSQGGFLITPVMAPFVVDLARAASVAVRLGAGTIAMDGPEVRIGTISGEPTPTWAGELQAVSAGNVTFGLKTLQARKQVTLLFVSDEWMMDAANGPQLLADVLSRAMSADLDKMILTGTGAANQPLGILSDPGRNSVTGIGGVADYVDVVQAVQKILSANYQGGIENLGWVLNPEIASDYELLVEGTTNAPLARPRWVQQLREAWTTALPTGKGIVGDFSQILIGSRMNGIRFEVLDAGTGLNSDGDELNAVTQVGRWIRMTWYGDTVCLRPAWFTSLEGYTT